MAIIRNRLVNPMGRFVLAKSIYPTLMKYPGQTTYESIHASKISQQNHTSKINQQNPP